MIRTCDGCDAEETAKLVRQREVGSGTWRRVELCSTCYLRREELPSWDLVFLEEVESRE